MGDRADAMLGMDTDRCRLQADRLEAAADRLTGLRARVDDTVGAATWHGPDADAFRLRWNLLSRGRLREAGDRLDLLARRIRVEAVAQERASAADGHGEASPGRALAPAGAGGRLLAGPSVAASLPLRRAPAPAALVSDALGTGVVVGLGGDSDGIDQVRDELGHLSGMFEDWAAGGDAPTLAQLGASTLLLSGAIALAPVETVTDTGLLDPRTDVTVHAVVEVPWSTAPRGLADLVAANDEARRPLAGVPGDADRDGAAAGRVRIQTVRGRDGGEAFIVHAPPTGGAPIWDPDSWGTQGNSAGWDSNLRTMAGQESAAMADLRTAMAAAGVPDGAHVLFVGHSQGGLTASHLAADPGFNRADGAPGSYDITHSFSVGSPVGTVVPAQASTSAVNASHSSALEPSLLLRHPATWPAPLRIADPVPLLDLAGYRVDGSRVSSPAVREVVLEAPAPALGGASPLENAHESVLRTEQGVDPSGGYHGSLQAGSGTDPVLAALQEDLEGVYLGDGVTLVGDVVVEVGREDLR
ncbi:hypothetical protein ACH0CV_12260 [Brachybacterium paraconglomeratum]|uniref:hypothetical protein n=1 Tax=Brachybacterium paraconglomeratum TaxID=173362 RepID=UPI00387A2436